MNHKHYEIPPEKFNGILATMHNNGWDVWRDCESRELLDHARQPKKVWKYDKRSNIDRSKTLNKEWDNKSIVIFSADFIKKYKSVKARIIELCENSYDEYPPNQTAQDLALKTLELLKNNKILPSLINSTDDSSLIFEFFVNDKFYLIEFYNSGEIVYLRRIEGKPKFVIETTVEKINKIVRDVAKAYTE